MPILDFTKIINSMANQTVERPNKSSAGTLSGHARLASLLKNASITN
ncbi:hypothetical protein [Fibrobacter intestinalis]|uniref:Uncharacterized protein n=1 Tax=Fibrobacter intestinalis TaxID=28122 RepID=A0A1T4RYY2_9BACT|nr:MULTISPECIES: hypothetical protein [Fibrobacter]PBC72822.1 hypothetical protein BGW94_0401 [Fibrobacter sp. NR9]SKA21155.1 hypothetical protein SAMN02745108_02902 [Fibrobacter intestinalis]